MKTQVERKWLLTLEVILERKWLKDHRAAWFGVYLLWQRAQLKRTGWDVSFKGATTRQKLSGLIVFKSSGFMAAGSCNTARRGYLILQLAVVCSSDNDIKNTLRLPRFNTERMEKNRVRTKRKIIEKVWVKSNQTLNVILGVFFLFFFTFIGIVIKPACFTFRVEPTEWCQ